jgi:putative ABC transport system permease protein
LFGSVAFSKQSRRLSESGVRTTLTLSQASFEQDTRRHDSHYACSGAWCVRITHSSRRGQRMVTGMHRFRVLWSVAIEALRRNKTRSALTALGIVIGVGCVVAMIGIGQGSQAAIQARIRDLGTNFLLVLPGAATQSGARIFTGQPTLTEEDVAAVRAECPSVAAVSAYCRTAAQLTAASENWSTSIQGVDVEWTTVRAWSVQSGAFFEWTDVRSAAKVCLLGATVARELFGGNDPVGEAVRIKSMPFRVVGVLAPKGASLTGQDQDDTVLVPYTTVMKLLKGATKIDAFVASAATRGETEEAQSEITALLRQRHRILPGQDDDFFIRSQEEIARTADETSHTLTILLGTAAALSLLVGGIGIMNIMLVSVTERTHEIGIRMAIGAKSRDILAQFLIEAITLSVAGGAIGVGFGVAASRLLAWQAGWPITVSPAGIALAFSFAAGVGIFFGFYPASKASRLDPINALRYE